MKKGKRIPYLDGGGRIEGKEEGEGDQMKKGGHGGEEKGWTKPQESAMAARGGQGKQKPNNWVAGGV